MVTLENILSTLALESIACIRVRARQCVISQRRHCNRVTFTVVFAQSVFAFATARRTTISLAQSETVYDHIATLHRGTQR